MLYAFRAPLPQKPKLSDHKHINGEESSVTVHAATLEQETGDVKEGEQAEKHSEGKLELVSRMGAWYIICSSMNDY